MMESFGRLGGPSCADLSTSLSLFLCSNCDPVFWSSSLSRVPSPFAAIRAKECMSGAEPEEIEGGRDVEAVKERCADPCIPDEGWDMDCCGVDAGPWTLERLLDNPLSDSPLSIPGNIVTSLTCWCRMISCC
jgi:hypothetical protein